MPLEPPMTCTDLSLTKHSEGCVLHSYPDPAGQTERWAMGWGSNRSAFSSDMTCTQEEADGWLQEDIQSCADTINRMVDSPVTQNQFNALCDFVYNVGQHAFSESTLLKKLNSHDIQGAADEFGRWVYSGGGINEGLVARRLEERKLFLEGTELS